MCFVGSLAGARLARNKIYTQAVPASGVLRAPYTHQTLVRGRNGSILL